MTLGPSELKSLLNLIYRSPRTHVCGLSIKMSTFFCLPCPMTSALNRFGEMEVCNDSLNTIDVQCI